MEHHKEKRSSDSLESFSLHNEVGARRDFEAAFKRSEHLLSLVLNTLPVAVQVMDRNGNIILSNPACRKIWGKVLKKGRRRYDSVQAYWTGTEDMLRPEEWASTKARLAGKSTLGQLIDIRASDGRVRTILNSSVPIRDEGEIIGAVVVNEDVTERRLLEKRANQAERLEAVGLLAAGVAHDFNNLLTVISGCAELLDKEVTGSSRELLAEIREAAESAGALTKQLLTFTRQSILQPKTLDLNTLLRVSETMLSRIVEKNIKISLALEPNAGHVKVDPSEFDQMLLNLVMNARDAMSSGGEITISTTRKDCPEGFVSVRIQDTGEGIHPDIREQVFEPFFTTRAGKRTGLGLSTVYGIVQQSGGKVEIESDQLVGSSIRIDLPLMKVAKTAEESEKNEVRAERAGGTILVVEDQVSVKRLVARVLERVGHKVLTASNGLEALQCWEKMEGRIDLLVTDVVMPEMGGPELVKKLRGLAPGLKVIFLSGYAADSPLQQMLLSPGVEFLEKPVQMKDLLERVREAISE